MIFVDTGAIYALADRSDVNHPTARRLYGQVVGKIPLAVSAPILTETWILLERRLGTSPAESVWEAVRQGTFVLLELEPDDLVTALEIQKRHRRSGLGFTDATTLALCEKHRLDSIFTFDRRNFGFYRPTFTDRLNLLPEPSKKRG